LNSFSWTTLLITFLQDIIQPPILPKLFSEKEINDKIKKIIKFGNGKGIDKNNKNTEKNFSQFFESLKEEIIHIPDCLINKDKTKKIYIKFNKNNENNKVEKNNLTCAEILLKFLEFIAYYFKYDTLYVRCSLENEGFFNMSEIENIYNNDDERSFYYYFKKKYLKYIDYHNKKKIRDGLILIKDPVDGHYNPCQTLRYEEYLRIFIDSLRFSYSYLIKYGNFIKLEEKIKQKNKKE